MATSHFEIYLRSKAADLLLENFNIYEASVVFGVDYRNLCAYVRGRKVMPLSLAFRIFDYLQCSVVVFRSC